MADADPMMSEHQLHPATAQILRYFDHAHLPPHLQVVSAPFAELAHYVAETLQLEGAELTTGLRKMLEGKDCVVRSALDVDPQELMARAASGVPEKPLVEQMTHNRLEQTLTITARIPDGLAPADVAGFIGQQVADQLHRSAAEQSGGLRRTVIEQSPDR
jgi:hypothetical protein